MGQLDSTCTAPPCSPPPPSFVESPRPSMLSFSLCPPTPWLFLSAKVVMARAFRGLPLEGGWIQTPTLDLINACTVHSEVDGKSDACILSRS